MSSLPQVRSKDLLRALLKVGFVKNRQTGSHVYLKHSELTPEELKKLIK